MVIKYAGHYSRNIRTRARVLHTRLLPCADFVPQQGCTGQGFRFPVPSGTGHRAQHSHYHNYWLRPKLVRNKSGHRDGLFHWVLHHPFPHPHFAVLFLYRILVHGLGLEPLHFVVEHL